MHTADRQTDPLLPATAGGSYIHALRAKRGWWRSLVAIVRPGLLSSTSGRFRWRWGAEVAAIFIPLWLAVSVLTQLLSPVGAPTFSPAALALVGIALVTIPLQAAGEEYLFRGLLLRSVGALFSSRRLAVAVSVALTSVAFALFHAPGTAWVFSYYVFMAVCFAVLAHRTSGLEASAVMHAVGNIALTLPVLLSTEPFDLTAVSGPVMLVPMVGVAVATALIIWRAERRKRSGA